MGDVRRSVSLRERTSADHRRVPAVRDPHVVDDTAITRFEIDEVLVRAALGQSRQLVGHVLWECAVRHPADDIHEQE